MDEKHEVIVDAQTFGRGTARGVAEGIGFIAASLITFTVLSRRTIGSSSGKLGAAALTVALLFSLFVSDAQIGPLQALLGPATAFVSGTYFISYILIRKRT